MDHQPERRRRSEPQVENERIDNTELPPRARQSRAGLVAAIVVILTFLALLWPNETYCCGTLSWSDGGSRRIG